MSDLHVGLGARAKDLCPTHLTTKAVDDDYKNTFLNFLRDRAIRADYLVLPGDVSHVADPSEFQLASQVVFDVAKALKIKQKHVIFVPGNHDVDWSVLRSDDPTGVRHKQRYDSLRHRDWVFAKVLQRGSPGVLQRPYFGVWRYDNLLAVGYNSSWDDDPVKALHHGVLAEKHLAQLDKQLASMSILSAQLRLFLIHHHPIQYSDPVVDPPDFSIMTNAEKLLAVLRKYKFDFLIHGHKHQPHFHTQIIDSSSPLAILGSGSFSVQIDTRWSGYVNNQFHLVYIEGRDKGNIYGRVESWTYLCGAGWLPSKTHNGIRHVEPFGTYFQPEELKKTLRPIIETGLTTKSHLVWSEIVSSVPRLKYLPADRAVEALDAMSSEVGFRRLGDPPDEIILLKT